MVLFTMTEIGAVPGVMLKTLRPILKKGFMEAGRFWQRELLPGHFTRKAISKYNYEPREGDVGGKATILFVGRDGKPRRKKSYTTRKQEKFGHKLPLVWSGASRALAGTGKVTATSSRVRITVPAPNLNRRPHMREEVVAVTPQEEIQLARIIERYVTVSFNKSRRRKVKKLF